MRKAQSSLEAALMISFMVLVFVTFIAVLANRMTYMRYHQEQEALEKIAEIVQQEIDMAKHVEGGYHRNFSLPPQMGGVSYSITLINSTALTADYAQLVIESSGTRRRIAIVKELPDNVWGELCIGYTHTNKLVKLNDQIILECD